MYTLIYTWFGYLNSLLSPRGYRLCLICVSVSNSCMDLQRSREGVLEKDALLEIVAYFGLHTLCFWYVGEGGRERYMLGEACPSKVLSSFHFFCNLQPGTALCVNCHMKPAQLSDWELLVLCGCPCRLAFLKHTVGL